jgi:hypothetical protein
MKYHTTHNILIIFLLILSVIACSLPAQPVAVAGYSPAITLTPFQPDVLTSQSIQATAVFTSPVQPEESNKLPIWIDPHLPATLRNSLTISPELREVEAANDAAVRLEMNSSATISRWVYALVAPFPTLTDAVASQDVINRWRGQSGNILDGQTLLMDEETLNALKTVWGSPADGVAQILPTNELVQYAWNHKPGWAIVPFENLEPRWKVIEIDGQSPIRKSFDPEIYPLSVPISFTGELASTVLGINYLSSPWLTTGNRSPARLTVVVMTGVTALVRATAFAMEQQGITYPARDIGGILREADLTHISNEVPFAENCPYPYPVQQDVHFCSSTRYIQLLEDVGTDIVEMTGDHFADWGTEAMLYTLQLYKDRDWHYYGGGENLEDGRKAITIEHNGNRLAFIGCNAKRGSFATASESQPGAVPCDILWMSSEIARLRSEGYLPIATFQHFEYYTYAAQPDQQSDLQALADAGAVIVSGSQAHQPQALEFRNNSLIHYGLGNLFFDQYDVSLPCRQGFIDRHVFYNGKYISTELLTIMFEDYARARLMTAAERRQLLTDDFAASGW